MKKLLAITIVSIILLGCEDRLEEKRRYGFQIFEEFGIAIKTPCELQIDSSALERKGLEKVQVYVCPRIFSDTTRTSFQLGELFENNGTIYHLKIWEVEKVQNREQAIDNQIELLKEFGIDSSENILIDDQQALLYGPIKSHSYEAMIPLEWFTIFVGVTGDKKDLESILSELIIEE